MLVAGGIGVNPFVAILAHFCVTGVRPESVTLLYTVGAQVSEYADVVWLQRLAAMMAFLQRMQSGQAHTRFTLYLSKDQVPRVGTAPDGVDDVQVGRRLSVQDVIDALGGPQRMRESVCYVCGPKGMTDAFVDVLQRHPGMDENRLMFEKWW